MSESPLFPGGINTFIELKDTPISFAGQSGKTPIVKATEDELEFITLAGGDMLTATYDPASKAEQLLGESDIVTIVGNPGSDTKVPSEQGTREALNAIDQKKVKSTYFATIASGTTSGTITKPAGAGADVDFIMDEWGTATDALVSLIEDGKPTFKSPVNAAGNTITVTLDTAGNYAFSDTPSPAASHALIYVYTCYLKNFAVTEALWETELLDYLPSHAASHIDGTDDIQSATNAQKGLATAAQITKLDGIEALAKVGDVTAAADITDNRIVTGNGGAKGVQECPVAISDTGVVTGLADDGIPGAKVVAATKTTEGVVEIATNTEVAAFTDEARIVTPEGLGYAIVGHLAYGIEYDDDESSPTLTRIGALAGMAAGSSPGNACLPIQAKMRRCLVADDGTVNYYLDASDSTKKEDGVTASVLTGNDGQVMVEIPKFYHSYTYNATTHVHQRLISSVQLPGFTLHPAFWKNGAEVDNRYIGAYEGVGYDDSTSAYFDGDDAGDAPATNWPGGTAIDTANDKLGSVSGFAPLVNETRAEFRSIAGNRGTSGWRQQDFYLVFAVQLLYLTEYASFDSQSIIGMGRTQLTGGTWAKGSYIKETGNSNGDGNATNAVAYSGDANNVGAEAAYMTYRGIENFYGNVWKWVDGFNINGGIPYVSNDDTDFADDTATGAASTYSRLEDINGDGITLPQGSNDYQKNLEQIKNGILPSVLAGASNTYITDYYYQAAGWHATVLGGAANDALLAGFACWYLAYISAIDRPYVGGRLCR